MTEKTMRQINRQHRAADTSHLWPIQGRFNVTERAIRQARKFRREYGQEMGPIEYDLFLSQLESLIVNDPKNQ